MQLRMRWMQKDDIDEMVAIEQASYPDPWAPKHFVSMAKCADVHTLICEMGERPEGKNPGFFAPVGFIIAQHDRTLWHIFNIAVHPDFRRDGVGSFMVNHLKQKLNNRRRLITLTVRERNEVAIAFWARNQFKAVKLLRGFYQDDEASPTDEDAILFEYVRPDASIALAAQAFLDSVGKEAA